jgi:hypothetical protein
MWGGRLTEGSGRRRERLQRVRIPWIQLRMHQDIATGQMKASFVSHAVVDRISHGQTGWGSGYQWEEYGR